MSIVIADGNNTYARAYSVFSWIQHEGRNIGGMYGFFRMLISAKNKFKPSKLIVVWDGRHGKDRIKKELTRPWHRKPFPNDYYQGMTELKVVLAHWDCTQFENEQCEADEVIGYLVKQKFKDEQDIVIISTDTDLYQLVGDRVTLWDGKKQFTLKDLKKKTGYDTGDDYIRAKALIGDKGDGIDGVKGIGKKRAMDIVKSNDWDRLTKEQFERWQRNMSWMVVGQLGCDDGLVEINGFRNESKLLEWCKKYGFKSLVGMFINL